MKMILGAVAGALAMGAVVLSYGLGHRQALSQVGSMAPAGYFETANPYLAQAMLSSRGVNALAMPAGYGAPPSSDYRVVAPRPSAQRVVSQRERVYAGERAARPRRSWQKSALLIGGSAASGAGVGALIGGKKGAGIGALLGGGSAAIFDQVKRH